MWWLNFWLNLGHKCVAVQGLEAQSTPTFRRVVSLPQESTSVSSSWNLKKMLLLDHVCMSRSAKHFCKINPTFILKVVWIIACRKSLHCIKYLSICQAFSLSNFKQQELVMSSLVVRFHLAEHAQFDHCWCTSIISIFGQSMGS